MTAKKSQRKRSTKRAPVVKAQQHPLLEALPKSLCGVSMTPVEWGVLAALMLVGMWLRFWNLSTWAIGGDDAIHILLSQRGSLWETLIHVTKVETHPAFKYLILYLLTKYVSPSADLLRFIGIIPGVLLMPAMYLLGRIIMGRAAGWALLLATVFSPTCIIQSENVRAYSMCQVALVVGFAALWRYMESLPSKQASIRPLVLYFGMMLLALLSQYGAILPVAGLGALLLLAMWQQEKKITHLMLWVAALHVLLAVFWGVQVATYIHFRGTLMPDGIGYVQRGYVTGISSLFTALVAVTSGFLMVSKNLLYYPFAALFVAGMVLLVRDRQHRILACIGFVFALALLGSVTQKYPMIEIRHGMWLMPFAYLPLAYFAEWVLKRVKQFSMGTQLAYGGMAVLALSNILFCDFRFMNPDYYRLGAYYYNVFAEQEVKEEDFIGAMRFLEPRINSPRDIIIMGLADGLRLHYYSTVNRSHGLKFMLNSRLQCRSWHNYTSAQLRNCLYRLWEVYPDARKTEKEIWAELTRLRQAREIYIVTGYFNDLVASKSLIDWSKPTYISPTLVVFSASPELRGMFINPPPTRQIPAPQP